MLLPDKQLDTIKEQVKSFLNLKFIGGHRLIGDVLYFEELGMGIKGREYKLKFELLTGKLYEEINSRWQIVQGFVIE